MLMIFSPSKMENVLIGMVLGSLIEERPDLTLDEEAVSLLRRAVSVAWDAHDEQTRKYTNAPYITHPATVAAMVSKLDMPLEAIAAAFLHDVLEDSEITEGILREAFPIEVVDLVVELTNIAEKSDGNRATRKRIEHERLGKASPTAQTIKVLDRADNLPSIVMHDQQFAPVYVAESVDLLAALTQADPSAVHLLDQVIKQYLTEAADVRPGNTVLH